MTPNINSAGDGYVSDSDERIKRSALHENDYAVFVSSDKKKVPPPARGNDEHDFLWSLKQEPHFSRRKEILKKYPEVRRPAVLPARCMVYGKAAQLEMYAIDSEAVWIRAVDKVYCGGHCWHPVDVGLLLCRYGQLEFMAILGVRVCLWYVRNSEGQGAHR
jgi:hypothetical protein